MIVFGTVVYAEAVPYFYDFILSLNKQSFIDFDLILVNDNVEENVLVDCFNYYQHNYEIINLPDKRTPAQLRIDLIKEAKLRGYELLIIGDIDDMFDYKRVSAVMNCYLNNDSYTFYYNDLLLFDNRSVFDRFPEITDSIESILEVNYLGLSNTSLNLTLLSLGFIESLYECTSFVFDWYLFSRILCAGGKGHYVRGAATYYRIYNNNFAGLNREKTLEKEVMVKKKHYELMKKYNPVYSLLLDKLVNVELTTIKLSKRLSYWWSNIIFRRTGINGF